jgi:nucleoside-diphosphate-sugar epimerase
MKIVLTGGTGYIGSALIPQLVSAGHSVTALVRSEASAAKAKELGAQPAVGDLFDTGWLAAQFAPADAVAHLAATGDATTQDLDRGVVAAAKSALGGTTKPYVHTSGIWIWGTNPAVAEDAPFSPPELTAWRLPVERSVLESGLTATIVAPGIVYGYGGGIPAGVLTRDDQGRVPLVGDGSQHWTTVHVDDIAALYRLVLERGESLGYVIGASGDNPTVRDLAEALAGDAAAVVPESVDASRARLGAPFADALLLDQQATGAKAKGLGWTPQGPSLLDDLRTGTYAG